MMSDRPHVPTLVLSISCPDRLGIVAEVSKFLVENGCNIVDSAQYYDDSNGTFFMRTTIQSLKGIGRAQLQEMFLSISVKFDMNAQFHSQARKTPTAILVSRFGHCLNDLLFRCSIGALPIDIRAVISNHSDFEQKVLSVGIPFHHLPVTAISKTTQEKRLADLIDGERIELVILARYMQVLSPEFCSRYSQKIINIHHSFLPGFKGSRPYHQAHLRGVKLIGATAHYVTEDLDEGPIIEQCVERVSHNHSVDEYVAIGRDIESIVLARAVKWHAEHRILLNGQRTVVFS